MVETRSTGTGSDRERVAVLLDELSTPAQVAPVSVGFEFLAAGLVPEWATVRRHIMTSFDTWRAEQT
ncbi:hypothetical protein ACFXG4_45975 [Nocardia sp. NPDC059246]|uniref:hypothetical protein n=1 Tax=unclassified Nocardia TaxID=2637762 RepID=UPI003688EFE8